MQSNSGDQYLKTLVYYTGGNVIVSSGALTFQSGVSNVALSINNGGDISMPKVPDTTNAAAPNMYISPAGVLYKSTVTTYTSEEVDKKLAIKDKLIEKLSDRLDKLEKKLK